MADEKKEGVTSKAMIAKAIANAVEEVAPDPAGFVTYREGKRRGLHYLRKSGKGEDAEMEEVRIGDPIDVTGKSRDQNGENWGLRVRIADPEGTEKFWTLPASMLAGDGTELVGTLLSMGWSGDPSMKKQVIRFLASVKTGRFVRCVDRVGWLKTRRGLLVFVLPDTTIGDTGGEDVVLQTTSPAASYLCRGTLEGQTGLFKLCVGNSRLMLALCSAFAGPLLLLAGLDSGGFNFWGASSIGKSTMLFVGGSCFDSVDELSSWRSTDNAMEGQLAMRSDNVMLADELSQAPEKSFGETVYMMGNSKGKGRAKTDGSLREGKSWRCMLLSTGEVTVTARIEATGRRVQAGQEVRLVDIPADAGAGHGAFENLHGYDKGSDFSDELKRLAKENCGHAGRVFLQYVVKNQAAISAGMSDDLGEIVKALCPDGSDGQVERVARRFALCAIAGGIAVDAGLFGDADPDLVKQDVTESVTKCFNAWIAERGGAGAAEDRSTLTDIAAFFAANGNSRFQDSRHDDAECTVINRCGYHDTDGAEFWVFPVSFRKEVCKGHNHKQATVLLHKRGVLKREQGDGHWTCKRTVRVGGDKDRGRQNFIVITDAVLDLGGDDSGNE